MLAIGSNRMIYSVLSLYLQYLIICLQPGSLSCRNIIYYIGYKILLYISSSWFAVPTNNIPFQAVIMILNT